MNILKKKQKETEAEEKVRTSQGSKKIEGMSDEDKKFYIAEHTRMIEAYYNGTRRYLTIVLD